MNPAEVQVSLPPLAVNIPDAARLVGCPEWTLHEAIRAGRLTAKRAGRTYIILIPELQKFIAGLETVEAA